MLSTDRILKPRDVPFSRIHLKRAIFLRLILTVGIIAGLAQPASAQGVAPRPGLDALSPPAVPFLPVQEVTLRARRTTMRPSSMLRGRVDVGLQFYFLHDVAKNVEEPSLVIGPMLGTGVRYAPIPQIRLHTTASVQWSWTAAGGFDGRSRSIVGTNISVEVAPNRTTVAALIARIEGIPVTYVDRPVEFRADIRRNGAQFPLKIEWDFGDGNVAQGTRVIHRFEHTGLFPVSCYARNGTGRDVAIHHIHVLPLSEE